MGKRSVYHSGKDGRLPEHQRTTESSLDFTAPTPFQLFRVSKRLQLTIITFVLCCVVLCCVDADILRTDFNLSAAELFCQFFRDRFINHPSIHRIGFIADQNEEGGDA
jgi:hypothetical protein